MKYSHHTFAFTGDQLLMLATALPDTIVGTLSNAPPLVQLHILTEMRMNHDLQKLAKVLEHSSVAKGWYEFYRDPNVDGADYEYALELQKLYSDLFDDYNEPPRSVVFWSPIDRWKFKFEAWVYRLLRPRSF